MKLTQNFSLDEFMCKCGCGLLPNPNDKHFLYFVQKLQDIRDCYKLPMVINSGIRCEVYNKKVGGAKNSSHLIGLAVDIKIDNDYNRLKFIDAIWRANIRRVGISKDFIHIDVDNSKNDAVWVY